MAKYCQNVNIEYFLFVIIVISIVCFPSQTSTFLKNNVPQVILRSILILSYLCFVLCQSVIYEMSNKIMLNN